MMMSGVHYYYTTLLSLRLAEEALTAPATPTAWGTSSTRRLPHTAAALSAPPPGRVHQLEQPVVAVV